MVRNVLMMGPPGSGKGTQAVRLAERRGWAHISTGDMLRAAMAAGTELGSRVKDIVERGDLVPDDLMCDLVEQRLNEPDTENGFLLDGFPRTVEQAEGLMERMAESRKLDCVVLLRVADEVLIERALSRGRADDTEDTIRHRLEVYRRQTRPVLDFLDDRVRRVEIDGVGGIDEITVRIERALDAANPAEDRS